MAENTGKDVKVQKSGFWINHLYPELGCSVVNILNVHFFALTGKDPLCVDEIIANKRNNLCYNGMHFVKQTCVTSSFGPQKKMIIFCFNLINFHHNTVIPEYIEMRIPRQLMPVDLKI
ncbi:hypothetical protein ACJMK2_037911 [Sinanodonta woodiana]|uniref:Uncharacterized protein n=1 Tax=Sinanodonta woodiana TaxID=1069815 RepID=A0ABD3WLX4_SINWO